MIWPRSIGTVALAIVATCSVPAAVHAQGMVPGRSTAAASGVLQSNIVTPDVTATILRGGRRQLLLAHVYVETAGNTAEGAASSIA